MITKLVLPILLVSSAAVAAPNTKSALPKKDVTPSSSSAPSARSMSSDAPAVVMKQPTSSKGFIKGLSVGLSLSTPTAISFEEFQRKESGLQKDKETNGGDLGTTSAMGVQAKYSGQIIPLLNYYGALNLEMERELNSFKKSNISNPPSYQPWIAEGGLVFNITEKLYAPIGMNYTVLNFTKTGQLQNFSMSPELGYQLGVGFKPTQNLAFEILQKEIRYENVEFQIGGTKTTTYKNKMAGIQIVGRYNF